MNPKQITIQGFKSFSEKQTFTFPTKAGFYFLTGKNELEPALEANGAGKSTLWEALIWCLYGKTSRNLKATDVGNWQGKHKCFVEYLFDQDSISYGIRRTWNPNSLQISENNEEYVTAEQTDVEAIVKLDFDSFLYSIIFSQFRTMFLDLKPAEKSAVLGSILQLDKWDELSDKAKFHVTFLKSLRGDTSEHVEYCKGQIQGVKSVDYTQSIIDWGENHRKIIETTKSELDQQVEELKIIKNKGENLLSERAKLEQDLAEIDKEKAQIDTENSEIRIEFHEISTEITKINTEIGILARNWSKLDGVEGVCPNCQQVVDRAHLEQEMDKIQDEIDDKTAKIKLLTVDLDEIKKIQNEITQDLADFIAERGAIASEISAVNAQINGLKTESQRILQYQIKLQSQFKQLQSAENPYIEKRDQQQAMIKNLEESINKGIKELEEADIKISSYEYWVKGFKEIRLFLISEILTHLEVEVNNALYQLGLQDWKIEFSVDKTNKSGTVKKGFTVLIYSPYNTEPVAWESWSGGEGQRLRLAGALGLSNLILARNGTSSFIEVYDEPSQFLSTKGINDLLETLSDRAREQDKQIWIIDHRSFEYPFDGTYSIVKDEEGSKFEECV